MWQLSQHSSPHNNGLQPPFSGQAESSGSAELSIKVEHLRLLWLWLFTLYNVYVASDDPKVLGECRKKYPEIEFLGDQNVAKSAAVSSRYSDSSLRGVIQDIHMLSVTDYLVCTFSSQVCRIAYEIMQQNHVDASNRYLARISIFSTDWLI